MSNLSNFRSWFQQKYQQEIETMKPTETLTSTEPIVGYRVWRAGIVGGQLYLGSVAYSTLWPYRKALEVDAFNNKGIHAMKSISGLQTLWVEYHGEAAVAGEVYLWGKVTECEYGYLAEFAYPKRLFVPEETDPTVIMQLEDGYGVHCEIRGEFIKAPTMSTEQAFAAAGLGISTASAQMQAYRQYAQQQAQLQLQQYYQQANAITQQNVTSMMQNAMLYGITTMRTYPGGMFIVEDGTSLPGK